MYILGTLMCSEYVHETNLRTFASLAIIGYAKHKGLEWLNTNPFFFGIHMKCLRWGGMKHAFCSCKKFNALGIVWQKEPHTHLAKRTTHTPGIVLHRLS